ncbi:MAG: hypothetical protein ACXW2C_00370 [Acidimicrobiia bacterium]
MGWVAERAVLGNGSGWRRTVDGKRLLRRARRGVGAGNAVSIPDGIARARSAQLRRLGVVRFDLHIPPTVIDHVASEFDRLIGDDARCADLGPEREPTMHRYLVDAHRPLPALGSLLTTEVERTIEAFYGCPFRVRSVRAYRNRDATRAAPEDLDANNWHLDPEVTCDLRYFVYLTDTTSEAAALETVDRPTTRLLLRSGFVDKTRIYGPARRILEERPVAHEGPAGTAILIDAQHAMHRAGRFEPGRRRDIAQFWITPSAAPMPHDWIDRLPDDPSFHGGAPGDG